MSYIAGSGGVEVRDDEVVQLKELLRKLFEEALRAISAKDVREVLTLPLKLPECCPDPPTTVVPSKNQGCDEHANSLHARRLWRCCRLYRSNHRNACRECDVSSFKFCIPPKKE